MCLFVACCSGDSLTIIYTSVLVTVLAWITPAYPLAVLLGIVCIVCTVILVSGQVLLFSLIKIILKYCAIIIHLIL